MDRKISLYLAGSIKKGHEKPDGEFYWTEEDMSQIRKALGEYPDRTHRGGNGEPENQTLPKKTKVHEIRLLYPFFRV